MLEEVVAFIVDKDECREVDNFDFPNGFHTEFGIFYALDALDVVLSQDSCRTADATEIESAVTMTSVSDLLRAVAFCEHNHRAAVALEEVDVWVHTACRGRSHRAARHAFRCLCRTCIVDRMVLEIVGELFAAVEAFFEACVSNVASNDDGSVERQACRHGIF